ncbi:MAG: hypothetical protein D6790_13075 [Caldilineae bacterium]|nr:MAG: hypothetical protein D6790_13075 [Caldilineae bacterium]
MLQFPVKQIKTWCGFAKNEQGQALSEYGVTLMVALILTTGALTNFGEAMVQVLVKAATTIVSVFS